MCVPFFLSRSRFPLLSPSFLLSCRCRCSHAPCMCALHIPSLSGVVVAAVSHVQPLRSRVATSSARPSTTASLSARFARVLCTQGMRPHQPCDGVLARRACWLCTELCFACWCVQKTAELCEASKDFYRTFSMLCLSPCACILCVHGCVAVLQPARGWRATRRSLSRVKSPPAPPAYGVLCCVLGSRSVVVSPSVVVLHNVVVS